MGEDAVAIFLGAGLVTRSRDTQFGFRQDSDFLYLTGFDHPGAVAVLSTTGGPAYTLYVQPRDREMEIWNGYRPGVEGARRDYEADEAHPADEFRAHLPDLVRKARRIYHVLGRDPGVDARLIETLENVRMRSRLGIDPADAIADPRTIVHGMRLFKEPGELDILRRAASISAEAHDAAARIALPGAFEYELEAELLRAFRRRGSSGPAYTPIVGSGSNATVLHYVQNDQKLARRRAGADRRRLRARGLRLRRDAHLPGGRTLQRPRARPLRGGARGADGGDRALPPRRDAARDPRRGRAPAGRRHARARACSPATPSELIAREAYRPYYMHSTSHWLGLDVHDVGSYRVDGEPRRLEPGQVFTVEPGLYVSKDDEKADPRFRGIGIRIEDDIAITEAGHENLTAAIPKAPDELEALVGDR